MKTARTILDDILVEVRRELAEAQRQRPLAELRRILADSPPVRPFADALRPSFGLIAEIKERSPSQGEMRRQNVAEAPAAYEHSRIVRCISVLTNHSHFGMDIQRLRAIKLGGTKPVLRKDFIFDEYQVCEARAFGADAVLLMANLLDSGEVRRLYDLARELGMDALFECHTRQQIEQVPADAQIYGINSRSFIATSEVYEAAKSSRASGKGRDLTTDLRRLELGRHLPRHAVKVAESGLRPTDVAAIRQAGVFDAVLVGTSLLTAAHGVEKELAAFEAALSATKPGAVKGGVAHQ